MKTNLIIVLVIIAVLVVGGGIYFLIQQNKPVANIPQGGNNIEISNFAFSSSILNVHVGDTVTWTNKDVSSHTITSDSGSELASPRIGKGETYSHTFTVVGTFNYHCSIHSTMKGEIIVE